MNAVSTAAIIDLLRTRPDGMLATEVCAHFDRTVASLSSRLSKLAAYGIIGMRLTSKVVLPDGKTGAAATRHFLPPAADGEGK